MRGSLLPIAVVAGLVSACYDPRAQAGAPCSETAPCPSSQSCIQGLCGGPSGLEVDAGGGGGSGSDAAPPDGDRDRDTVLDSRDNCPDLANLDQGNEDGDRLGDACDPCPIEASDAPSDPDGDGVAGICDPRPATAGDKIAAFSGFHGRVPEGWLTIGTTTLVNDQVTLVNDADSYAAVIPPITPLANGTVTASLAIDALLGDLDAGALVILPYDQVRDEGITCELYAPDAGQASGRYLGIWDPAQMSERGRSNLAWKTATSYRLAMTRNGRNYACTAAEAAGAPQTANGTSSYSVAQARAAVLAYAATVRVQWLMVVTSP